MKLSWGESLGEHPLGVAAPAFTELLDLLAEAVTIRDRAGEIVYANPAALASMGFGSFNELVERPSADVMGDYIVEDEHGRPLTIEDVPSVRLMHDKPAEPLLMRTIHRITGATSWRLLKATPLRSEAGDLIAAVTVIEDVTAVKTAELRTRVLAESGRVLASSLDYQQTLENIARIAVPALADWCAVDLIDPQLRREHTVITHRDPAKQELARRLLALEPAELDPHRGAGQVMRTGVSVLAEEISEEVALRAARSEEHAQMLRELQIRSAVVVPLAVPSRTIGVMTLVTAESRRRLNQDDLELAEQLGRRAAVAVENARLHTTLAGVAETLQKSLLPAPLPALPGWEVSSLYRPAGSEQRIDVGGDFYELFGNESGWFALLGDVTGRGVPAAALTALIRHGAKFASRLEPQPAAILARLDEELREQPEASFSTAVCMRIEDHRLVLSSAGHPPALIVSADGTTRQAPTPGPMLGAFADAVWPEETVTVADGELVLLFTDGVIEAPGERDRFGTDRLRALLSEHAGAAPAEVLDRLEVTLDEFRSGPHRDDVVALALRPASGGGSL